MKNRSISPSGIGLVIFMELVLGLLETDSIRAGNNRYHRDLRYPLG